MRDRPGLEGERAVGVRADRTDVGAYRCPDVLGTLRLSRAHGHLHLWRRGTADRLTTIGGGTCTGPGYTLTLHTTGPYLAGFTLDLARAPGLRDILTGQRTQPEGEPL